MALNGSSLSYTALNDFGREKGDKKAFKHTEG